MKILEKEQQNNLFLLILERKEFLFGKLVMEKFCKELNLKKMDILTIILKLKNFYLLVSRKFLKFIFTWGICPFEYWTFV